MVYSTLPKRRAPRFEFTPDETSVIGLVVTILRWDKADVVEAESLKRGDGES